MQHKWVDSNSHGGREIGRKNHLYVPSFVPHFWSPAPSGFAARRKEKQRLGLSGEVTVAGIERAPLLAATASPGIGHRIANHWAPWGPPLPPQHWALICIGKKWPFAGRCGGLPLLSKLGVPRSVQLWQIQWVLVQRGFLLDFFKVSL